MEPIYKTICMESYEDLNEYLKDYVRRRYKPVWVEVICALQYTYVIVCCLYKEPDIYTVPSPQFEAWWEEYGPLPAAGEVMMQTFFDAQGYTVNLNLVVVAEPDEVVKIEEAIYQ